MKPTQEPTQPDLAQFDFTWRGQPMPVKEVLALVTDKPGLYAFMAGMVKHCVHVGNIDLSEDGRRIGTLAIIHARKPTERAHHEARPLTRAVAGPFG